MNSSESIASPDPLWEALSNQVAGAADPLLAIREHQAARWQCGERVLCEEYLTRFPQFAGEDLLVLVVAEIQLRRVRGEDPTIAEYQSRFPQFAADLPIQFELLSATIPEPPGAARRSGDPSHSNAERAAVPGYVVGDQLGGGTFGVVYRATHTPLGRVVALKVLREGMLDSDEPIIRFIQEARLVARLDHPNVMRVYDVGRTERQPYFAAEYLDGGTLAARLRNGPLEPREAAAVLHAVAQGVAHAHAAGIVHRDLKPANILFSGAGVPKVADFGLAKHVEQNRGPTATGATLGSPAYMAPEQIGAASRVGPTADVYSLGAVLYECLTGRAPVVGATYAETLRLIKTQVPKPADAANPHVPTALAAICTRCLAKLPTDRYESAQALADALGEYLEGKPAPAPAVAAPERRGRTVPAWLALVALASAALFGGLALKWKYERDTLAEQLRVLRASGR